MQENNNLEKVNYLYLAFGMKIASSLPLPELEICAGIPEVHISIGRVPKDIDQAIDSNSQYQARENELLLHITGVGSYYIKNGNKIIVEPAPEAETKAVRLFLLGSAMGAVLLQRGILPIHGSAVATKDQCFIIAGVQGAGKSTLAAALSKKGFAILTDDIAAITFDQKGIPWVYPSYPQQKLWRDSLEAMGKAVTLLPNLYGRIDKYAVDIQDSFCRTPKKLAGIYEINKENSQQISMSKLSGTDKLPVIMNNIYRFGFISGLNIKEEIFRYATSLAKQITVFRSSRPTSVFTLQEQVALLEQVLRSSSASPKEEGMAIAHPVALHKC